MNDAGFFHFLQQADGVAVGVLAALALMSIASWSLMAIKLVVTLAERGRRHAFFVVYRRCATPAAFERQLAERGRSHAGRRLAAAGFAAWRRWSRRADQALIAADGEVFIDRALHRALLAERARQEEGLALLAAVGSTAPFVGLFGTVWGIYHALLALGAGGQATLDKVAGPVGEALAMTAIGLAVAIPASLGYNACVRAGRIALAELDDFAHELHAFLATGLHAGADSADHGKTLREAA